MKNLLPKDFSIGNAAGLACKSLKDVQELVKSHLTEITFGSITAEETLTTPESSYFYEKGANTINSIGLSNLGIKKYKPDLPKMLALVHKHNKKFFVSIAPKNKADLLPLVEACIEAGVDGIELNASCPNMWSSGEQVAPLAFQLDNLRAALLIIIQRKKVRNSAIEIRVKLSPYSDTTFLQKIAELIKELGMEIPLVIVTCNTFPNGKAFRWEKGEKPEEALRREYGGISGRFLKPIALGQVAQFRALLPKHRILGVGGIENAQDVLEYALGAKSNGVQIGTALFFAESKVDFINKLVADLEKQI